MGKKDPLLVPFPRQTTPILLGGALGTSTTGGGVMASIHEGRQRFLLHTTSTIEDIRALGWLSRPCTP